MSRVSISRSNGGGPALVGNKVRLSKDEFPLLDFKELSLCLQECDFVADEELVSRPTGPYIRALFEQILDTFMGFSVEYCIATTKNLLHKSGSINILRGDASDENSDSESYNTTESINTLVLFKAVNVMLENCGVHDFTLMDLVRPEALRTRRILSGVINFARFREEHLKECEQLARVSEESVQEIRQIEEQNVEITKNIEVLKERLAEEMEAQGESEGGLAARKKTTLTQLTNYNSKLEQELKKLQKSQEALKLEHSKYKDSKTRLLEKLEDNHYLLGESAKELEKLKNYSSADPTLIKRVIEELKLNLDNHQQYLQQTETACRDKSSTVDAIQQVEDELRNLIKIAQEITNDLRKLDNARDNIVKQGDELDNKKQISEELTIHTLRVRRQLVKSEEKISKLRQQSQDKERNAKEKLKSLELEYERLSKDRELKQEKLDQTRAENAEIEASINSLRQEFDSEFKNAEAAVAKLNDHIREYLYDIGNRI